MKSSRAEKIASILNQVVKWAETLNDIYSVALVGSQARGTARIDSDIDLIILTSNPSSYRKSKTWLEGINWQKVGSTVKNWQDLDYGLAWSRHVYLEDETAIEFGFSTPKWAAIAPLDPGTFSVVSDGCRILYDRHNLMQDLLTEVKSIQSDRQSRSNNCHFKYKKILRFNDFY